MKMLVTGGAGFVGTNLIKKLLSEGHEVVSVDNYSSGLKENEVEGCRYYNNDLASDHVHGIYVDHNTYPSWRDEEFDTIFHMAALARIQTSLKDPLHHIEAQMWGPKPLMVADRKLEVSDMIVPEADIQPGTS